MSFVIAKEVILPMECFGRVKMCSPAWAGWTKFSNAIAQMAKRRVNVRFIFDSMMFGIMAEKYVRGCKPKT